MHVSAYSLKSLDHGAAAADDRATRRLDRRPHLRRAVRLAAVRLDGPAKAALEATSRYLARDLGKQNVRCNLISAGPIGSMAAKSIPGFAELADVWNRRAPLAGT